MKKFEARKQIKSRLYSRYTIVALLLLVILLAKGVLNIYFRETESSKMRKEATLKLADVLGRKENLSIQIDKLNSNEGMEEEIRTKFNVTKPGENVVIIVDNKDASTTPEQDGFFAKLWHKVWK